jgi:hypothetical protein
MKSSSRLYGVKMIVSMTGAFAVGSRPHAVGIVKNLMWYAKCSNAPVPAPD